jgi:hypothetical protein
MGTIITNRLSLLVVPLALLLAGGAALSAQEARPRRFGLQASCASPRTASLKEGGDRWDDLLSTGMGAAVTCEWGMGANGTIRARAEYLSFGGKDRNEEEEEIDYYYYTRYTASGNYGLKAVVLGADYIHAFRSSEGGPYIFGGLGYYITNGSGSIRFTEEWGYYDVSGAVIMDSHSDTSSIKGSGNAIGISIGAGWRFSPNFSGELRYATTNGLRHNLKFTGGEGADQSNSDIDLTYIQVSVCYRF